MTPGSGRSVDIRDAPAYSFAEASRYLGIPKATLRHWMLGRSHRPTASRPLIRAPTAAANKVSFNNLVEAHVLRALRAGCAVRMADVRNAVSYAEDVLGTDRLLLRNELRTTGQDMFLDRLASLTTLSRSGQLAMRRVLAAYLGRIDRDDDALPFRLYPLRAQWSTADKPIAIDPRISFGRPTVAGSGVSTEALVNRIDAGESIEDLAWDYGLEIAQIEAAIVYERAAA